MDFRAKFVCAAAYAHSTFNTRRSQWRTYLRFFTTYHLVPVPAKDQTIIRFLIHLSFYCKYSTVLNYLSAINVLHRHFGFNVILGDAPVQKLPMTPDILLQLHPRFTARSDSGFWAAMLIGFYTFFRKSNLVPNSEKDFDPAKNLCRHDIIVRPWGLVICVRWSKTIQFRERQLLIPVMRLSKGHPLCPVQAYERHILEFPVTQPSPAFLHYKKWSRHSHYTLCINRQVAQGPQSRRLPSQQILGPQFSPWWSFLRLPLRCTRGTYQSPRGLVFGRCFALYRSTT